MTRVVPIAAQPELDDGAEEGGVEPYPQRMTADLDLGQLIFKVRCQR